MLNLFPKSILTLLACCLLFSSSLLAQDKATILTDKDVPAAIVSSFKARFTNATEVKWKKNKSGKYEVDFKLADKKAEAKFLADGKWDESKLTKAESDLPAKASEYLKKNYAGYKIGKVVWKEENAGAKKVYEVKVKKDATDLEVVFDASGTFVKIKDKEKKESK